MPKFLGLEKKWWQTFGFAIVLLACFTVYNSLTKGLFDVFLLNRSLADLAFTLAALSMSLASVGYLFKFGQIYISYRMHLGVMAFFVALVHFLIADYFYFFASNPPFPNYEFGHVWPLFAGLSISNFFAFICGVLAVLIFAFMALITLKYFLLKLGGLLWRKLLRYLGFTALTLVLVHFFIKNIDIWLNPQKWGGLPPLNLLLWILGIIVIVLRLTMAAKLRSPKTKQQTELTPQ